MQKYADVVQDAYGNAITNASVTVTDGGGLATIYSDNGMTETANPISTNALGEFSFYAANGRYNISVSFAGGMYQKSDVLIQDFDDIPYIDYVQPFTTAQQTATTGQTYFAGVPSYTPGSNALQVFVNGLLVTDYTETSSTSVTFTSPLSSGDEVRFISWNVTTVNVAQAANVPYTPAGTGAVVTDVQTKLRESVSVKDFGAVGDGVTDDTAAIQAASNTGKHVAIPKGTYVISTAINVNVNGTQFCGEGVASTTIYQSTANSKIFNITANNVTVRELSLDYSGTPTSGAVAIYAGGAEGRFANFKINRSYKALEIVGINCHANAFDAYNHVYAGVHFNGTGGSNISGFKLDAISTSNASNGNILMSNFVEGCTISNGDILNGNYSLLTEASVYGAGTRPAYNRFTSVFFDSSAAGSYIDKAVDFSFSNCWFSAGRFGAGSAGCTLGTTDSIAFVGTAFANCGAHGVNVTSYSSRTLFVGCKALGNSVTSGAGVSHGFNFSANTNSFTLQGCTASNVLFAGTQGYGINIASGTSNSYSITGCYLIGNSTGSLFDGGNGGTKTISGNPGYMTAYRGSGTVGAGSSSVTLNHFLSAAPAISSIVLTPQYKKSFSGIADFWVSAVTATTFTVETDVATTNAFTFTFDARITGA